MFFLSLKKSIYLLNMHNIKLKLNDWLQTKLWVNWTITRCDKVKVYFHYHLYSLKRWHAKINISTCNLKEISTIKQMATPNSFEHKENLQASRIRD